MTHLNLSLSIPSKWSFGQVSSRVVCLADFWMTRCPRWNIDMICSKTRQCHSNVSDCKESQYDKEEARHCCVVVELPKKLWAPNRKTSCKAQAFWFEFLCLCNGFVVWTLNRCQWSATASLKKCLKECRVQRLGEFLNFYPGRTLANTQLRHTRHSTPQ